MHVQRRATTALYRAQIPHIRALYTYTQATHRSKQYRSPTTFIGAARTPGRHSDPRNAITQRRYKQVTPTMVKREDLAGKTLHSFSTAKEFETFLDHHHKSLGEVYIRLAKKASGIQSISLGEAVEVALCFGWIDGSGCGIDDHFWTTRFLPRRVNSMWSKKNVETATRLMQTGRMREAGMVAVQAARDNGRWDRAYAGPATIVEPQDFKDALALQPGAAQLYATLNRTERYAVLWKIETASPAARAKRIRTSVELLANGKRPARPGSKDTSAAKGGVKAGKVVKSTKRKNVGPAADSAAGEGREDARTERLGAGNGAGVTQPRRSGLRARS